MVDLLEVAGGCMVLLGRNEKEDELEHQVVQWEEDVLRQEDHEVVVC